MSLDMKSSVASEPPELQASELIQSKIRKLDTSVVNRIAAGEIIVQPANALKEMLENSIDANASAIDILAKDGGLKLLQITDNGSGIHRDDLELLCERFATSKLRSFNDLQSICTYGFRGEALASISHISHLSVVSKVASSPLAYKSFYLNGKQCSPKFKLESSIASPKPVAGKDGTQITVEDLFYNSTSRLRTLKSKNEEWAKLLDVAGKYATHTEGVGITCKKFGESLPAVATRPSAPLKERIRNVFGTSVASDLIEFDFPGPDFGLVRLKGAVSGLNYNNKRRSAPIFFINNRLVACDPLRRAISTVFSTFLPKGNYPFVYMSLDIIPENLDVNVHPTKREVGFLNEDEIIDWISGQLNDVLFAKQGSRKFKQSTLKRLPDSIVMDETTTTSKKYRQENKLVRVDASQSKINQFVKRDFDTVEKAAALPTPDSTLQERNEGHLTSVTSSASLGSSQSLRPGLQDDPEFSQIRKPRQEVCLDSISELREDLGRKIHRPLTTIFTNLVGVGVVDAVKRLACFQYDVKLYLCDYGAVLNEFFYQVALSDFANYGEYILEVPLGLRSILEPLYKSHSELVDIDSVINQIMEMKDMFSEYFQLGFSGEELVKLPMLLKGVHPSNTKIPFFIYRLGAKVNYQDEKTCFAGILRELALLYVPDRISRGCTEDEKLLAIAEEEKLNYQLEHVIYPELRRAFLAPENLSEQVVQVADLPGLYRVFERC